MNLLRNQQTRSGLASKLTSWAGISTSGKDQLMGGTNTSRISVSHTIFKGKAALAMSPMQPKFCKTDSGAIRLAKEGSVLLTFFPAIGPKKYDWQKKQVFALSAVELGSLITLDPTGSCEFYHDPSLKTSLAGQVKKSLSVTPLTDKFGSSGYFFNLSVINNTLKSTERFNVPVTKAEFAVMCTAFSFILPHIMGWDRLTAQTSTEEISPRLAMRPNPSIEWDR